MPEFERVEWHRPLECTLILRHIMVLLRIRVNVPLTLTRGPGKHETKKRQTDMDILLAPPSPQRTAQYWAGNYLDDNTSSGQGRCRTNKNHHTLHTPCTSPYTNERQHTGWTATSPPPTYQGRWRCRHPAASPAALPAGTVFQNQSPTFTV